MPIVADASVAIRADMARFRTDLKAGEREVKTFGQSLSTALSPRSLLTGLGIGIGINTVTDFLGGAITAASNLNETMAQTVQIFGEEAMPALEAWSETAADAFGQSQRQALDAAATFAIFAKSAGLSGEELIGFSTELTVLASDFASFRNTSPEEAITAIGAALRGESEPIRRYGVLLDEATLRQRAFTMGIIDTTTQALTPQQRVLAAYQEILAQSSDAQGDFTRTSGALANQQRTLSGNLEEVSAAIGEKMLPVMIELANFANDVLVPALRAIVDNAEQIGFWIGQLPFISTGLQLQELASREQAANAAAAASVAPGGGGAVRGAPGGSHTININAPTVPMTPRDIGRELRRTGVFGD